MKNSAFRTMIVTPVVQMDAAAEVTEETAEPETTSAEKEQ